MFNLESAVENWANSITTPMCGNEERLEEIKDHLYSHIESSIAKGASEEQAFYQAVSKIGQTDNLSSEFIKNQTQFSSLCALAQAKYLTPTRQNFGFQVAHALIFAIMMLGVAILTRDSVNNFEAMMFILAMWWVSFSLVNKSRMQAEWRYIKRFLRL